MIQGYNVLKKLYPYYAYFDWSDGCSNKPNKNRLFCLQYPLHVLTSDVVWLLSFRDSTCYYCVKLCIRYWCGGQE